MERSHQFPSFGQFEQVLGRFGATLDPKEGYKTKTGTTSSVIQSTLHTYFGFLCHSVGASRGCLTPAVLGPMCRRNGYVTLAFLGSPWWGEIKLAT